MNTPEDKPSPHASAQPDPVLGAAPAIAPSAPQSFETVTFDTPIQRGEQVIASVQLRKPKAGELRGLTLQALGQGDANSVLALVPRISMPPLLMQEVENLDAEDFGQVVGTVMGFFMSKAERAEMVRVLGLNDPATTSPT